LLALFTLEIATNPEAKFAFTWALAVTSNGQKVEQNFELAEKAYEHYVKTGNMPTNVKAGQAQKAINKSLKLFNDMKEAYGPEPLSRFHGYRVYC
jgi:predicted AAA+ superfamily ATPase